jgi:hypothetical protein
MTKSEKLRKAGKVCWILGAFFTWSFVRSRLANSGMEPAVMWAVALGASLGLQYVLTLIESTIIEGMLPAPWALDFRKAPTLAILAIAAYGCFLFDVLLNLGGVYTFTSDLTAAVGEVKQLGISDYVMQVVQFIATFFFSMLFALGSELLEALADHYDGKVHKPNQQFGTRQMQSAPQEHRNGRQEQDTEGRNAAQQVAAREAKRIREQANNGAAVTTLHVSPVPQKQQTPAQPGNSLKDRLEQARREKGL